MRIKDDSLEYEERYEKAWQLQIQRYEMTEVIKERFKKEPESIENYKEYVTKVYNLNLSRTNNLLSLLCSDKFIDIKLSDVPKTSELFAAFEKYIDEFGVEDRYNNFELPRFWFANAEWYLPMSPDDEKVNIQLLETLDGFDRLIKLAINRRTCDLLRMKDGAGEDRFFPPKVLYDLDLKKKINVEYIVTVEIRKQDADDIS